MRRRDFIKLLGVASSASVATSCGLTPENSQKLIPYLVPPDREIIPGKGMFLSTTCTECPVHCGISVQVRDKVIQNRHRQVPIKIEGLPGHPINDGRLCIRGQAALHRLYHAERFKQPMRREGDGQFAPISWEEAYQVILQHMAKVKSDQRKIGYLSGRTTGALAELMDSFCTHVGVEKLPEYEPLFPASVVNASFALFGRKELPEYRIDRCDFLLSVGADLLETFGNPVQNSRRIAAQRKKGTFRWVHLEPHVSLTGLNATQRLTPKPDSEWAVIAYLLQRVHQSGRAKKTLPGSVLQEVPQLSIEKVEELTGIPKEKLQHLEESFFASDRPLTIAGGVSTASQNGAFLAALTGLLQWATGQVGATVDYTTAVDYSSVGSAAAMESWLKELDQGRIGVLFISRCNPVGTAPQSWQLHHRLKKADLVVGLADLPDETTALCDIILPVSHSLESWGEVSPRKDVASVLQPVLDPIYETRTEGDILLDLYRLELGAAETVDYREYVQKRWRKASSSRDLPTLMQQGYYSVSAEKRPVRLRETRAANLLRSARPQEKTEAAIVYFPPSLRFYDGRSRRLPLLQEIPDPLSSVSYGRWIAVSVATAKRLGIRDRDELRLGIGEWETQIAARIQPGLPEGVFVVYRDQLDAYPVHHLNPAGEPLSFLSGARLEKTGARVALPILSGSTSDHERGIIAHFKEEKESKHEPQVQMYEPHEHKVYRWAMAIDLEACTGCSACVAACYQENNIPLVGKEEHVRGREMAWIRIEPYYTGEEAEFLPMMCQQCDNAPCEPVCPVYATYHNPEGLNAQIYNRCVGTRYCSNNCPYKARRFNWFDHEWPEPLSWGLNPDVSLRNRGVMEKCTFCVHRIRSAKDAARDEDRLVLDGEVVPACAQTCPADAIVFGNLLDPESRVAKLARSGRAYHVLEELNTQPAVTYLSPHKKEGE